MDTLECKVDILKDMTTALESEKSDISPNSLPESIEKKFLDIGKKLSESSLTITHLSVSIDVDELEDKEEIDRVYIQVLFLRFHIDKIRCSIDICDYQDKPVTVSFNIYKRLDECHFTHLYSSDKWDDIAALTPEEVKVVDELIAILKEN
jgi:hypothetical protein